MNLIWRRDAGILTVGNEAFEITSVVRNELNGRRKVKDPGEHIVRAVSQNRTYGPPVMPRPFPLGTWEITGFEFIPQKDSDYYPVKILTNASQPLDVWIVGSQGYIEPSGSKVIDWGYWLHCIDWSSTTEGCGKVSTIPEILKLASIIYDDVTNKNCKLEVL